MSDEPKARAWTNGPMAASAMGVLARVRAIGNGRRENWWLARLEGRDGLLWASMAGNRVPDVALRVPGGGSGSLQVPWRLGKTLLHAATDLERVSGECVRIGTARVMCAQDRWSEPRDGCTGRAAGEVLGTVDSEALLRRVEHAYGMGAQPVGTLSRQSLDGLQVVAGFTWASDGFGYYAEDTHDLDALAGLRLCADAMEAIVACREWLSGRGALTVRRAIYWPRGRVAPKSDPATAVVLECPDAVLWLPCHVSSFAFRDLLPKQYVCRLTLGRDDLLVALRECRAVHAGAPGPHAMVLSMGPDGLVATTDNGYVHMTRALSSKVEGAERIAWPVAFEASQMARQVRASTDAILTLELSGSQSVVRCRLREGATWGRMPMHMPGQADPEPEAVQDAPRPQEAKAAPALP